MSIATICPDNSTECLLRAILERGDPSPKLDMVTLIITAAIGFLALIFALTTVFQGLLAAGPGRMKANSATIGIFSQKTRYRISWSHFAWRSTASIPIIYLPKLEQSLYKRDIDQDWNIVENSVSNRRNDGMAASWLVLLRSIGLENASYFDSTPCAIDYLPPEIPVPLATIDLHTLAILAALFDDTVRIERAGNLLTIRGTFSQVSFREHPVLGTLAAYERYDLHTIRSKTVYSNCTYSSLETADGIVKIMWEARSPKGQTQSSAFLLFHAVNRNEGVKVYNFEEIVAGHQKFSSGECADGGEPPKFNYEPSFITNDDWGIAIALMVGQTEYEFRPFPWRVMNMQNGVLKLAAQASVLSKGFEQTHRFLHQTIDFIESDETSEPGRLSNPFKRRGTWIIPLDGIALPSYIYEDFCTEALVCCFHFLSEIGFETRVKDWTWDKSWRVRFPTSLMFIDSFLSQVNTNQQSVLKVFHNMAWNMKAEGFWQQNGGSISAARSNTSCDPASIPLPSSRPSSPVSRSPSVHSDNNASLRSKTLRSSLSVPTEPTEDNSIHAKTPAAPAAQVTRQLYRPSFPASARYNWLKDHAAIEVLRTMLVMRGILFAASLRYGADTSALFEDHPYWGIPTTVKML